MPSLRLVLPTFTLLVFSLCWLVRANPLQETLPYGFVTNYVTPVANLNVTKLLGRWYVVETVPTPFVPNTSPNITEHICLLLVFHYDENGTLVAQPFPLLDGEPSLTKYTFPMSENGVWDVVDLDVSGEPVLKAGNAVVHVDELFLAVATCNNTSTKDCGGSVLVRHLADADRQAELQDVRRRLVDAGADCAGAAFVNVIDACRSIATAAPDLSAQNGPSATDTD